MICCKFTLIDAANSRRSIIKQISHKKHAGAYIEYVSFQKYLLHCLRNSIIFHYHFFVSNIQFDIDSASTLSYNAVIMENKLFNLQQQSLSEQVYDILKMMILSGIIEQGERIPEERIAQQFQVSRTPIREALKKLSDYGLVELKPRSYSVVPKITSEEAKQIADLRVHLEKMAIRLFAALAGEDDYRKLESLAHECEYLLSNNERARAFEKDSEFHLQLMKGSGNRYLYEVYEKLDARIQLLRLNQSVPRIELIPYIKQHIQLIKLMQSSKIDEACELISKHSFHHIRD